MSDSTDNVTFIRADGKTVATDESADIVGPMADLDGDGALEAPFVDSQGDIYAIDANNETQFIASSAATSNSKVAVGDWTGDGTPEVLYGNESDSGEIYYANVSGTPTEITSTSAKAVLGVEDFDNSGQRDVVFIDSSANLDYYNGSGVSTTGYNNFGSNGGIGAGAPADFRDDGEYWVPAIDGGNVPELVNASGSVDQLNGDSRNKAPVAGVDWAGDEKLEFVHLKNTNIKYTYLNGTTETLNDASGNNIGAVKSAGVAGVESRPPLEVTGFDATASGSQNVSVTVTTNKSLSGLNVTLSGVENATLTLGGGEFSETSTDPYTYEATYNGSTDGDYTAELKRAESTGGDVVTDSLTDEATVDDAVPTVESVRVTDATDGDGSVDPGDTVRVRADVTGDVGTVRTDLSAFDAGTVELTQESGDTYAASASVGSSVTDGDYRASVTARDGQGNTESLESGTLAVDTASLSVTVGPGRTVTEDEQVQFSVTSVSNATGSVSYEWSFGDGGARTGDDVVYTFVTPDTYTVTVEATDESGATATASVTVTVEADSTGGTNDDTAATTEQATTQEPTTQETTAATTTQQSTATTKQSTSTAEESTATEAETASATTSETTESATTAPSQQTPGEAPGFGVTAAVVALAAAALLARRE